MIRCWGFSKPLFCGGFDKPQQTQTENHMNTKTTPSKTVKSNFYNTCNGHIEKISWSQTDIQELKYGMLNHALEELRDNRRSKKMKQEAWGWLMSDENSDHSFSSDNCCSELGMSINNLRSMLNQLLVTGVIKL